ETVGVPLTTADTIAGPTCCELCRMASARPSELAVTSTVVPPEAPTQLPLEVVKVITRLSASALAAIVATRVTWESPSAGIDAAPPTIARVSAPATCGDVGEELLSL